ncbi:hypothetical protein PhiCh1p91 [Natrialba phage PhiCh1]|uniref:Virus protein phiCh1-VP90 n=2 Tax=root TaxID=1 RepID=D3T2E2_NATMM|nr:hypothetical protein [Natrialba magadii]NP_666008.1 hypothetical protein PhiCh1p91 [Natrialba phage PhiCh1]YP_010078117.1 uncharacterized protein KMC42_gp87 [Natrialba phage PhiCh1]AAM88764.1 unknown [Natrialba phage PhiCh1]ADD07751.1 virus protein phiCh1-VP90 [Natrialba magadii ATCC 43099]ELY22998.1 hypothetical protein C500_21080 [Natrialba magadii ATCC 43099]QBJ01268.1 uncharacterized protein PhiCh1_430 [Natrialba phage PhiCh1]
MSTDSHPESDIPRDPSAYRATLHFKSRFEDAFDDYNRHLDGEIVRRCITEGELTQQDYHTSLFESVIGGVTYRIVVNPRNGTCVSGFPVAIDWQTALDSGRWTRIQLKEIEEFLDAKPNPRQRY